MTHQKSKRRKKAKSTPQRRSTVLFLIGLLKLVKALLLVIVAVGALQLLHKDVGETVAGWVEALRFDPDNRFIHSLLEKSQIVSDHQLETVSAGSIIYAILLSIEGTGLLLQKRWAEYVTIFITGSLIPFEIYELSKGITAIKSGVTLVNVAVVVYLIVRLYQDHPRQDAPAKAAGH